MSRTPVPLSAGDEVDVVVTTSMPFGAFVRTDDGLPGLVRRSTAPVGTTLRVRVVEVDSAEHRFSAETV